MRVSPIPYRRIHEAKAAAARFSQEDVRRLDLHTPTEYFVTETGRVISVKLIKQEWVCKVRKLVSGHFLQVKHSERVESFNVRKAFAKVWGRPHPKDQERYFKQAEQKKIAEAEHVRKRYINAIACIRKDLNERRYRVKDLAYHLDMTRSGVSNILRGHRRASANTLRRLALAAGMLRAEGRDIAPVKMDFGAARATIELLGAVLDRGIESPIGQYDELQRARAAIKQAILGAEGNPITVK